jgi:hypothetical protein
MKAGRNMRTRRITAQPSIILSLVGFAVVLAASLLPGIGINLAARSRHS